MKTLEVRRHSIRKQGAGSQLSQAGVSYARALGATMGPFAVVAASVVPRARETAIAMGFAVDLELVTLTPAEDVYAELETSQWWQAPYPFVALAESIAAKGAIWRYGSALVALWRDIMTPLPDDTMALVIGHSGELETALATCFPNADHAAWGKPFGPCEGARLEFDGEPPRFTQYELLRAPADTSPQ